MIKLKCTLLPNLSHERFVFSGGEVQVKLKNFERLDLDNQEDIIDIYAHLTSSDDVMELCLLTNALRNAFGPRVFLNLIMPYIPYARQDRIMTEGESLAINVFANIINSLNFYYVEVWDAHSDVSVALLNNCHNKSIEDLLPEEAYSRDTVLVAPDAGAIKKVQKLSQKLKLPFVHATKIRDVKDGGITGTKVYSNHIGNKNFLIVDDICDGGRTFVELAKELRPLTNGHISLYVTHGIFSKGLGVFNGLIDNVYSRLSFPFPNAQSGEYNGYYLRGEIDEAS